MIAIPHNQQRAAGRRSWGSSVRAAVYAPHSIVDNQNQSRSIYRARVISLARPGPASVLHLPRHCASAFYTICRGDLQARQRRLALPSLERGANFSRRLISSRLQFHRIGYQPGSYVSDPFEAHLERPSQVRGSDAWNHERRGFDFVQNPMPRGKYV
jgi:hypothetical protein